MKKSNRGASNEDEWSISWSHMVPGGSHIDPTERVDVRFDIKTLDFWQSLWEWKT